MALITYNPCIEAIRGRIGNLVFSKSRGKTYVSLRPGIANRDGGGLPHLFHVVLTQKGAPILNMSIATFITMQWIDGIDLSRYDGCSGSQIVFRGRPGVDVETVDISISSEEGRLIEKGSAVVSPDAFGQWLYTTSSSVAAGTELHVDVTVTERPGSDMGLLPLMDAVVRRPRSAKGATGKFHL